MIVDTLANRHIYQSLSPRIATALAHLASTDFSQLPVGNYPLDGEDIFVHYSAIKQNGYKTLTEGQLVEFDLVQTEKGLQATNVIAVVETTV